jgi:2-hydroxychromene-2-carboxylate isomerase
MFRSLSPGDLRATWAEAQNLGDETQLRELLENVGVTAIMLMADIERKEIKDRLD